MPFYVIGVNENKKSQVEIIGPFDSKKNAYLAAGVWEERNNSLCYSTVEADDVVVRRIESSKYIK